MFGLLGSGNLGNDGSLEAVLTYLRTEHPDTLVDFMVAGPQEITARYGLPARPLHWNRSEYLTASGVRSVARKGLGKGVDAYRTLRWVAGHDVVIVPGMGVLEATLPLRPWGFPYSLFLLTASARLVGTKVALVSVGANREGHPWTRHVFTMAARLAHYRSYRDSLSRTAMRESGLNVSHDEVYPDLVFALPTPSGGPTETGTVGVGVMSYLGSDSDRDHAAEVRASYVAKMKRFCRWLVDAGHRIRLFTGDLGDEAVVAEVIEDLRQYRPDLDQSWVVFEPATDLAGLMSQMTLVDVIVATRYHNVLCALKMAKLTISIGYSAKNDVLMHEMGLGEFCQSIKTLDVDLLIEQFTTLVGRSRHQTETMALRNAVNSRQLERQFEVLSTRLFAVRAGAG